MLIRAVREMRERCTPNRSYSYFGLAIGRSSTSSKDTKKTQNRVHQYHSDLGFPLTLIVNASLAIVQSPAPLEQSFSEFACSQVKRFDGGIERFQRQEPHEDSIQRLSF